MTSYDAAMAGVIIAGMVWGAFRGVTWQLASIASLVLGYGVSHPLSARLAPQFPGEPVVARALAMVTVYLAVSGGTFLAAWLVRAALRTLQFEAFDRHLGMLLGGTEGALLGLVVTFFVVSLAPQTRGPIFGSPTGKVVGQLMAAVGPVLPAEARSVLAPFWTTTGTLADRSVQEPASAPLPGPASDASADSALAPSDPATTPSSLNQLIQEGETRLGQAITEGAAQGVERATAAATAGGTHDGGAVERR